MVLVLVGAGVWGWNRFGRGASAGYDLVLKRTDKAVITQSLIGKDVLSDGSVVAPGTTLSTLGSLKTVFQLGPASVRAAAQTEITFTGSESSRDADGTSVFATLELHKGRLWLVSGGNVKWIVRTPSVIVRPAGRVTEVDRINGVCTLIAWQGKAEMALVKHPDRNVLVAQRQTASFNDNGTLENPTALTLTRDDPWVSWNLLETMRVEINEK